ncbi:MAG: PVC-type heme-binding CxxCH protein [Verrucomicrobiota bacterium]
MVSDLPRMPALSPAEALKSFHPSPGFSVSLAAAEPQVMDPVSMSFDAKGALFVAEMRDYSERRAEKLSRIRKLEDRDGDGVFETSTVFMDGLAWATSVLCRGDAVYVAATPDIWRLRDTDGDGVADAREVIFTGFGDGMERLNVQALVNSLTLGPDGRIYGATAPNGGSVRRPGAPEGQGVSVRGRDFSFDPDTLDFRTEPGGGQFGMTFDAWGRRFVCSNSHHLQWIAPVRRGGWLPAPAELVDITVDGPAAPVFRLSPDEPWRVMRTNWRASGLVPGLVEGDGKASGYFTSASGIHLWRNDAIVADCGSNLVHRKQFRETLDGPVAERPATERDREFLASTDTWFRPVSFTTGPDGALYIADMCREYIEHPDSLPPNLKSRMDLNSGNDRGRIWRVKPAGPAPASAPAAAGGAVPGGPPPLLREITETPEAERPGQWKRWWDAVGSSPSGRAAGTLLAGLRNAEEAGRFYARCAPGLPAAQALDLAVRLKIPPPEELRETIFRLAAETGGSAPERLNAVEMLARMEPDRVLVLAKNAQEAEAVRLLAVWTVPQASEALLADWETLTGGLRSAVVTALGSRRGGPALLLEEIREGKLTAGTIPAAMAAAWRSGGEPEVRRLAAELLPAPSRDRTAAIALRQAALTLPGDAGKGAAVFQQRCAVCHRDGDTGSAVGPDRASFRNKGKPLLLLAILDPDREVAPQFARTTVTLKDGAVSAGITLGETPETIRLMLPGGQETSTPRGLTANIERDTGSLMPTGVEEGLSDQEIADLLAWLTR